MRGARILVPSHVSCASVRAASVALLVLVVTGCSKPSPKDESARVGDENARLGGDIAARVGDTVIPVSLVATVAATEHVSLVQARDRLVDDAIAAHASKEKGLVADHAGASWRLVAARARFTADTLLAAAKAKGPPTDEEVRDLSEENWREVDRPPAVRVIHALVKRPENGGPDASARAHALAERLRIAVEHASDADDFQAKAKAVAHDPDLTVVVESLPPFIENGELIDNMGAMVEPFAKAAHAIGAVGGTSPIVETSFGWHVIHLLERLPEKRMPFESRRIAFTEVTYARRAKADLDARLADLRKQYPKAIVPAAEELMRTVSVTATDDRP